VSITIKASAWWPSTQDTQKFNIWVLQLRVPVVRLAGYAAKILPKLVQTLSKRLDLAVSMAAGFFSDMCGRQHWFTPVTAKTNSSDGWQMGRIVTSSGFPLEPALYAEATQTFPVGRKTVPSR